MTYAPEAPRADPAGRDTAGPDTAALDAAGLVTDGFDTSGPVAAKRLSLRARGLDSVAGITATLVGTQAVTSILGFAYWTIATHRFPVSSVGVASDATSTMQLLGSFGMLGFGTLLISRLPAVAHARRRVLVRSSLVVVVAVSLVLGLLFAGAVGLSSGGLRAIAANPLDAILFAAGVALTGCTLVLDQAVLAAGSGMVQLERNAVASISKIGFLAALSVAGAHGGMAIYLSWVLGIIASLPVVLHRTANPGLVIERPRWLDRASLRGSWRDAANHHVLNLALQAPLMLFPALITVEASAQSTGYFATVLLLAGFVFVLPYAVSIGLFASGVDDGASVRQRMRITVPFGIAASLCADVVLIPFAPLVLRVFGHGYATHGVLALRLIVLAGLPFVLKDHYVALRRVEHHTGRAARLILVTSLLEVVAAVVGLRVDAVTGLCVAWLAVVYVEAVVFAALLWSDFRGQPRPGGGRAIPVTDPHVTDPHVTDPHVTDPDVRDSAMGDSHAAAPVGRVVVRRVRPLRPTSTSPLPGAPPQPERSAHPGASPASRANGPLLFVMGLGLGMEGLASVAGNDGVTPAGVDALFWVGLVLIVAPAAAQVLSERITDAARLGFVLALGLIMQLGRFALFPTQFVFHDELAHANTLRLLETTHRLFSSNPSLPVSSFYPGLELCTSAIHALLGLSDRMSAVVVLTVCRLVLTLAVYLGLHRITGSGRWAALGSIVYVCNEQYLFFNSQFSYQTLALPLALFTVWTLLRVAGHDRLRLRTLVLPVAALAATVVTHHLTSALLVTALCLWAVAERMTRGATVLFAALVRVASLGVVLVVGWSLVPGNPVWGYLGGIGSTAVDAVSAVIAGTQSHALFQAAGYRAPVWEIAASVASEVLVVAVLVAALLRFWRRRSWRVASLAVLLAVMAVAFPIVPAGHLTGATSEVTDRAAGFLFVGVGFVVGGWLCDRLEGQRRRGPGPARRPRRSLVLGGVLLAFVGQTILGSGPQWAQTPGSFLVSSDSRSIDGPNLAAAHWEAQHLPRGTRVIADRDASLLAGAVGGLYPVSHIAQGTNGSPILLTPTWTRQDAMLVRQLRIEYVIVDLRDATGLPRQGVYYESGEYDQDRTTPVPISALTKFAALPGVTRVYDNGSLEIYDVTALENDDVPAR